MGQESVSERTPNTNVRVPVSWLERFPAHMRLFAATLLALVAVTAVGAVGFASATRDRIALDRLGLLNTAYQRFRGAQIECTAVRGDVLAALSSEEPHQGVKAGLLASVETCRRQLLGALAGSPPEDFREAVDEFRPLLTDYLDRATAIAWLDPASRELAAEHRVGFEHAAEALAKARRRLDTVFERRSRAANATVDGLVASSLWAIAGSWLAAILVVSVAGRILARSISRGLARVRATALAIADGDSTLRCETPVRDDVSAVAAAVNRMADALQTMIARLQTEQEQDAFSRQVADVLDMTDTESETYAVVARAMRSVTGEMPMELLVADSSRAHLERATVHPDAGASCCPVESPYGCMAVRRGHPVVFETSEALNACVRLRERPEGPVSAVCVPLNFMGRALGVLHATGAPGQAPPPRIVGQLTTLGLLAGGRIGTVRAFERTQLQASTDSLTGLLNRRTLESRVRRLDAATPHAVIVADLDQFKQLNDTLGHDAGDRVLRVVADVFRQALPLRHHVARWGGEEFVIVLESHDAPAACAVTERIRTELAAACQLTNTPKVTASFGIADSTMGRAFDQLMRIADDALYQSKESGRNRTTIGDPLRVTGTVPRRDSEHRAAIEVAELASLSS